MRVRGEKKVDQQEQERAQQEERYVKEKLEMKEQ